MTSPRTWPAGVACLRLLAVASAVLAGCGSSSGGLPADGQSRATSALTHCNRLAIDASGLDHTPPAPGETRVFGEQFGPTRASRAMAIVHIAMFEAVNAASGRYESYTGLRPVVGDVAVDAAVAQAAHDTLVALFPAQTAALDDDLEVELGTIADGPAKDAGVALGAEAAASILMRRADDGSDRPEPTIGVDFFPSDAPGKWRPDPISRKTVALGAFWGAVRPFVLPSGDAFRLPPPPALDSAAYAAAFAEVKRLGGDGVVTPTARTSEETLIGIYWAYDGTPSLCAPPRLYNQIAVQLADAEGLDGVDYARFLALANVAMADAAIAVWESKYFYQLWRPITGIRESDPGTGPTGEGDGNPDTIGDPTFTPLGAPASNTDGPNFTPPFPSYPSGHAGIGAALFETMRRVLGRDDIAFTFVSDELNGITHDATGAVRPLVPRSFTSLSAAEQENGQSRIYLGIHWPFDKTQGIAQGEAVADYVVDHAFGRRR